MPASVNSSTTDAGAIRNDLWVTVLAGGIGSRFWPVSTPSRPKQLLPLASERPLIRDTVDRALKLAPPERLRILTGEGMVEPFTRALPELASESYLIEPQARGTAPVLAWAAFEVARTDPDGVIASLHADHRIEPPSAFIQLLNDTAAIAAETGHLLTIGVPPTRPEPGYGHIQPGAEIRERGSARAVQVDAFHEKPDLETAERYNADGFLWNTGIFIWKASAFLDEVRAHAPEVADHLHHLEAGDVEAFFAACTPISVDVAVLERSGKVAVVPATFEWDDVGSWGSLARTRPADEDGNVVVGRAFVQDARNNVIMAESGPVVLFGVDDLVVVRTEHVTFVTSRERAPDLKELLPNLPDSLRDPE